MSFIRVSVTRSTVTHGDHEASRRAVSTFAAWCDAVEGLVHVRAFRSDDYTTVTLYEWETEDDARAGHRTFALNVLLEGGGAFEREATAPSALAEQVGGTVTFAWDQATRSSGGAMAVGDPACKAE